MAAAFAGQITTAVSPQPAPRIDFRRDIQPLFKEHCFGCHGPSQQMAGMRLDVRSSALKLYSGRLQPGSSTYSLIYQRLIDDRNGPQMPLTGALRPEQIQTIKTWIDEGAQWPDDLAGDVPPPPPNPVLVRLMDAALYGTADSLRQLLDRGADPNLKNAAGATALMWAVGDLAKTALLLDHGADPNARSDDGQTPLVIAATQFGSSAVVKLLLDRGAKPVGGAVVRAASAGDDAVVRELMTRGAELRPPQATEALMFAMRAGCAKCAEVLLDKVDAAGLSRVLVMLAPFGDAQTLGVLLDRGADINAKLTDDRPDLVGRTPLMMAAASDLPPAGVIKMLIDRGANVNAKGPDGETALDLARRNGKIEIVDVLVKSGAQATGAFAARSVTPKPALSVTAALQRSIPLLQRGDVNFIQKTGCISCHSNTLTAMTISTARAHRLPIDESIARQQRTAIAKLLDSLREPALLATGTLTNAASNILIGLAAEQYPADATTDAASHFIKTHQLADGRWRNWFVDHRPPLQGSDIDVTATSIRALMAYAPQTQRVEYDKAIQRAAAWLTKVEPRTTDERAMQLLGLKWSGMAAGHEPLRRLGRALLGEQRSDGGWAQLPTLGSDAYATGQVLYALHESGALAPTQAVYQRGVKYLMNTQLEDGSWYVQTRSIPFQPYFESGFPHGPDQWISSAATNWASMALALSAR